MAVEVFLDLARIDVFAAADDHVLDAADDVAVAVGIEGGQIAGVHPAGAVQRLGRALRIIPIAQHHGVAPCAELARLAAWHDPSRLVHDLDLDVGLDAPDGGDPGLQAVVAAGLEADRAGLGHAIGDSHLRHVHPVDHLTHYLDGAWRAGHDPRTQAGQVKAVERRIGQHGDEHGGHAIERLASLIRHRLQYGQWLEPLRWQHHGGTPRDAAQIAHHHAKAVIQRHWNAQSRSSLQAQRFAHEEAVVQDIVVAERRALGKAGGAAGELDVDRVVKLQGRADIDQPRPVCAAGGVRDMREALATAMRIIANSDDDFQQRQPTRLAQFTDHRQVFAGLVANGDDQGFAAHLVQGVLGLRQAVGRVDVD